LEDQDAPHLFYSVEKIPTPEIHVDDEELEWPSMVNYNDQRIYVFGGCLGYDEYQNTMH
jgi:hypothetical protein